MFGIKKEVVLDLPNGLSLNVSIPGHVDVDSFLEIVAGIESLTHNDEQSALIRSTVLHKDLDHDEVRDIGRMRPPTPSPSHEQPKPAPRSGSDVDMYKIDQYIERHLNELRFGVSTEMQRMKDFVDNVLTNAINEFDTSFASFGGKFNQLVDRISLIQNEIEKNRQNISALHKQVRTFQEQAQPDEQLALELHSLQNKVDALSALFDSKLSAIESINEVHSLAHDAHQASEAAHQRASDYESKLSFVMDKYNDLNRRLDQDLAHKDEIERLQRHMDTHTRSMADMHEDVQRKLDGLKIHYDSKFNNFVQDMPPPPMPEQAAEPEPERRAPRPTQPAEEMPPPPAPEQSITPPPRPGLVGKPKPAPMPAPVPREEPEPVTHTPPPPTAPKSRPKPVSRKELAQEEQELPDMLTDLDKISSLIDKQISEYKKKRA